MGRRKRPRGGQPGNQNARKHGLYSPYMNGAEYRQLQKALRKDGADKILTAIRIKMESALRCRPTDPRLYRQASKLLMDWFRSQYDFDQTTLKEARSITREIFNTVRRQVGETIKANSPEEAKNLAKRFKLDLKKLMKNDGTNRI